MIQGCKFDREKKSTFFWEKEIWATGGYGTQEHAQTHRTKISSNKTKSVWKPVEVYSAAKPEKKIYERSTKSECPAAS